MSISISVTKSWTVAQPVVGSIQYGAIQASHACHSQAVGYAANDAYVSPAAPSNYAAPAQKPTFGQKVKGFFQKVGGFFKGLLGGGLLGKIIGKIKEAVQRGRERRAERREQGAQAWAAMMQPRVLVPVAVSQTTTVSSTRSY